MVPSDSAEAAWSGLEEAIPLCARGAEGSAEDGILAFKSIMGEYTIRHQYCFLPDDVRACP